MTKFFAFFALVSMMSAAVMAAPHGGGHMGGGYHGGGYHGGGIGHGPVVIGGGYHRGPIGGGYYHGYPGYAHNPYYGTWQTRRWVNNGYYFNNTFYPVVGFGFYTCTAVNAYGQIFSYRADIYDAQAGALNNCQMFSGYGMCQIANCGIY